MESESRFEGFAIVEVMGHRVFGGYVTTEYFGDKAMLKIALPERTCEVVVTERDKWMDGRHIPAGSRVRIVYPRFEKHVAVGALYCLTATTQANAEDTQPCEIEIIEIARAPVAQIAPAEVAIVVTDEEDE